MWWVRLGDTRGEDVVGVGSCRKGGSIDRGEWQIDNEGAGKIDDSADTLGGGRKLV